MNKEKSFVSEGHVNIPSFLCQSRIAVECTRLVYQTYTIKMLDSKQKGILTELQCITAFNELGYHVSIPYGENSRYDFIADIDTMLLRIQVKSASPLKGAEKQAFCFSCRSTRVNTQGNISRKYTKNEIDYFCTFYLGKCYLIPVEECSTEKTLRFVQPPNCAKVNLAENYELQVQLQKIIKE